MKGAPFMERRLLRELQLTMEAVARRPVPWEDVLGAADIAFSAAQRVILEQHNRILHVTEYPDTRLFAINELIKTLGGPVNAQRNPGLRGTPKQVAWAERIRQQLVRRLADYNPEAQLRRLFTTAGRGSIQTHGKSDPVRDVLVALHSARYRIDRIASAPWFIDHRDDAPAQLIYAVSRYSGPYVDG